MHCLIIVACFVLRKYLIFSVFVGWVFPCGNAIDKNYEQIRVENAFLCNSYTTC